MNTEVQNWCDKVNQISNSNSNYFRDIVVFFIRYTWISTSIAQVNMGWNVMYEQLKLNKGKHLQTWYQSYTFMIPIQSYDSNMMEM